MEKPNLTEEEYFLFDQYEKVLRDLKSEIERNLDIFDQIEELKLEEKEIVPYALKYIAELDLVDFSRAVLRSTVKIFHLIKLFKKAQKSSQDG
jgi:hypothetical protein